MGPGTVGSERFQKRPSQDPLDEDAAGTGLASRKRKNVKYHLRRVSS